MAPACWQFSHETPAGEVGAGGADAVVAVDGDDEPLLWQGVARLTDHPPCIPAAGATSSHNTNFTITACCHTSSPHSPLLMITIFMSLIAVTSSNYDNNPYTYRA